jgi:O-antigen ligase
MKSFFSFPLSADWFWETAYVLVGFYLLLFPPWTYPQSIAVALGGGLLLLLFRVIPIENLRIVGRAWGILLAFLLISSFWSLAPGTTLQSTGLAFLGTLLYLMARANSPASQSRLEIIGLIGAAALSVMAVYQLHTGFGLVPLLSQITGVEHDIVNAAVYNQRAFGTLALPGSLAAFLILFIPLGFILAKTNRGFKRGLYALLTILLLVGLLATQSVGACACLTLAVLLVLLKRGSKKAFWIMLVVGAAGLAGLILTRGLHSWLLAAFDARLVLWKDAWGLFLAHPFGTGLGTFDEVYQRAGLPMVTGARFAHNLFMQLLVETGVAGLLIFLAALVSLVRRLKTPFRWEGWGMGTGLLAFFLFSLVDLPFQMPELVWVFAGLAGRLELKPERPIRLPEIPVGCVEVGLLAVFLLCGFLPPFSAWGFCLLALALWGALGFFQKSFESTPLWIGAGALFLAARAFFSPSALGAARFLEIAGFLLCFFLVLPSFRDPKKFLKLFFLLGLAWAGKVWWISIQGSGGLREWFSFQYSDIQGWMMFQNPKQLGIFLIPLVFLFWQKTASGSRWMVLALSLLTLLRLKASAAFLGLGAGGLLLIKRRYRWWIGGGLLLALVLFRTTDPSATKYGRLQIWQSAVTVWSQSPLWGIGPGAFEGEYFRAAIPRTSGVNRYQMTAQITHNEFLELLTAFGLVGLGFGLVLFWVLARRLKDPAIRSGLAGLGAASFVDFCFHTPLIALQGAGLLAGETARKTSSSSIGGFLAAGLALGLFAPPIFSNRIIRQVEPRLSQGQFSPEDLGDLERAERMNGWDARVGASKAAYLERLYLETLDASWKRKSDEAFERNLDLEKTDGHKRMEGAERLTRRFGRDHSSESLKKAAEAWDLARKALPFDAFACFGEGQFYLGARELDKAIQDFQRAVELEPNYAAVWVKLGLIWKQRGERAKAREFFQRALDVYDCWEDAERINPLERQMVSLPPDVVAFLRKEAKP